MPHFFQSHLGNSNIMGRTARVPPNARMGDPNFNMRMGAGYRYASPGSYNRSRDVETNHTLTGFDMTMPLPSPYGMPPPPMPIPMAEPAAAPFYIPNRAPEPYYPMENDVDGRIAHPSVGPHPTTMPKRQRNGSLDSFGPMYQNQCLYNANENLDVGGAGKAHEQQMPENAEGGARDEFATIPPDVDAKTNETQPRKKILRYGASIEMLLSGSAFPHFQRYPPAFECGDGFQVGNVGVAHGYNDAYFHNANAGISFPADFAQEDPAVEGLQFMDVPPEGTFDQKF